MWSINTNLLKIWGQTLGEPPCQFFSHTTFLTDSVQYLMPILFFRKWIPRRRWPPPHPTSRPSGAYPSSRRGCCLPIVWGPFDQKQLFRLWSPNCQIVLLRPCHPNRLIRILIADALHLNGSAGQIIISVNERDIVHPEKFLLIKKIKNICIKNLNFLWNEFDFSYLANFHQLIMHICMYVCTY